MVIVKCYFFLFFLKLIDAGNFPFYVHADQMFVKCPNGISESFNSTSNIHSTCIQLKPYEQFYLFQIFIQCPDGRFYLEYNRTFSVNVQFLEYSIAHLQPYCFINHQYGKYNQLVPYQTRYISENGTFTQIISFQCQYDITMILNDEFYLVFKLMNYSLCRYLVKFTHSNGKCNQYQQQIYKIQGQIKSSMCYYQLGLDTSEVSLEYFDQVIYKNLPSPKGSIDVSTLVNRTIIIIIVSITVVSLLVCFAIFIAMYSFGLFRL